MTDPSKDDLTEERLESLRDRLQQKRHEVQHDLAASRRGARPGGPDRPFGHPTATRGDAPQPPDMAGRRRQLQTQLAQIQQALGKMLAGTYGECVRCGEPIGYECLDARPELPFCIRCQDRSAP